MGERPRFFDDLAGVAGGAFSALSGLRDEAESTIRARADEAIRKFDLVKREDLEAVQEMAALARAGQEAAEARLAALEAKVEALSRTAASAASVPPVAARPDPAVESAEPPPIAMPASPGTAGAPIVPPSMD